MKTSFKFSGDFQKRLKKLPALMNGLIKAKLKRDATTLVKIFHDGIKQKTLGLQKLAEATIEAKRRKGMEQPETPLYGKGDRDPKKSYMNMLRIRETKNAYIVRPSIAMHYSGKIKLRDLFRVHEYGSIIAMGHGVGARMVRIPPRPAFLNSYQIWGKKRIKEETSKTVKKAIERFMADGKENHVRQSEASMLNGIDAYFKRLLE